MRLLEVLITLILAGVQPQQPPGRIMGTVVDDATGAPLPNARITIRSKQNVLTREVVTDNKGAYMLDNVPAGPYQLQATRETYLSRGDLQTPAQAFPDIAIEAGRIYNIPFRLVRSAILGGRVYGGDGEPVRSAQVQLLTVEFVNGQSVLMPARDTRPVNTDADGNYRFEAIPPGQYFVSAAISVEQPGRGALVYTAEYLTYYPGVSSADEARAIPLDGGDDIQALDFTLQSVSSFVVSGRVINALSDSERPTYNYYLVRRDAALKPIERPWTNRSSNPGEFEIGGVQPGAYELYIAFERRDVAARPPTLDLTVYAGRMSVDVVDRDVPGLTVQIEPGIDVHGQIVLDASSATKPNVQNIFFLLAANDGMPGILSPTAMLGRGGFVNPDGTFVLPHATRGRYRLLMVFDRDPAAANLYLAAARLGTEDILGKSFKVNNDTAGPMILDVRDDGDRVQGRVIDRNDEPVVGAHVMFVPPINFREDQTAYKGVTTDEQGRFTIAGIRPGRYTAFAAAQRQEVRNLMNPQYVAPYLGFGLSLDITRGQTVQQDLKLFRQP